MSQIWLLKIGLQLTMVPANAQRSKHTIKDKLWFLVFFFLVEFTNFPPRWFHVQEHRWKAIRCSSRIHTASGRCLRLTIYWLQIRIHARSRPAQYVLSLKDKMGIIFYYHTALHINPRSNSPHLFMLHNCLVWSWKNMIISDKIHFTLLWVWKKSKKKKK